VVTGCLVVWLFGGYWLVDVCLVVSLVVRLVTDLMVAGCDVMTDLVATGGD